MNSIKQAREPGELGDCDDQADCREGFIQEDWM